MKISSVAAVICVLAGIAVGQLPAVPESFHVVMASASGGSREVWANATGLHELNQLALGPSSDAYTVGGATGKTYVVSLDGSGCEEATTVVWPPAIVPGDWSTATKVTGATCGTATCDAYSGLLYTVPATAYYKPNSAELVMIVAGISSAQVVLTVTTWTIGQPSAVSLTPPASCFSDGDASTSSKNELFESSSLTSQLPAPSGRQLPELPCALHARLYTEIFLGTTLATYSDDEIWLDNGNGRSTSYFDGYSPLLESHNKTFVHRGDLNTTWTDNHAAEECLADEESSFQALPIAPGSDWEVTEYVVRNGVICDEYKSAVSLNGLNAILSLYYKHGTGDLVVGNGTATVWIAQL